LLRRNQRGINRKQFGLCSRNADGDLKRNRKGHV
jgi:hypothetical protein